MSWSHCHTSVTSDDMVTVMVTSYDITEKDIEGSRRIISYNIYNIYWPYSEHIIILDRLEK